MTFHKGREWVVMLRKGLLAYKRRVLNAGVVSLHVSK
jgi:hypothetical protein